MKKKLVVLTGAGISAESGMSTFRDSGGLWEQHRVEDVATPEGYERNPQLVTEFYNSLRMKLPDLKPNQGHRLLAMLEDSFEVTVVTQNVDDLHERAGSSHVIHLHGELTKVRPEHGVYEDDYSEREVLDIGYDSVSLGDKAPNGSQLRPHIVFFGEAVPKIEKAIDYVERADIVLIVGTSLQVYPAAGLYRYAKDDARIFIIDPADISLNDSRITHIKDVATSGMREFVRILALP